MTSNGFLPSWAEANDTCPGVCQSCVITTLEKDLAIRLMIGTTCSPSFTARLPPGRKQFCTSITSRAEALSGLIGAPHALRAPRAAIAVVPQAARICRRSNMAPSVTGRDQQIRSQAQRKAPLRTRGGSNVGRSPPDPSAGPSAFWLDAVAHGTEAGEGRWPLIPRRAANDAHRGRPAKADPLHDGDLGVVL